ncbi:MAG: quinone-dependent dihydroorotate dehydrogenase [Planctomycetes bacterium]|nr:quinone-dependent dihydroorotate dehydrogenase [Planctomycetota bacterium]
MYQHLLRPLLFALFADPEAIHARVKGLGISLGKSPYLLERLRRWYEVADPRLETTVCGLRFAGPVGLAAGFDKNADLVDFLPALGLGFMEIGSVTARPSAGNPPPRLFRLPDDEALINRLGLNNDGAEAIAARLAGRTFGFPLGVNLAKTNDDAILGEAAFEDLWSAYGRMAGVGDFHVLNISCPNTGDGRTFEDPAALTELLSGINPRRPLFLKISPDLEDRDLEALVGVVMGAARAKGAGLVLTNTTGRRTGLATAPGEVAECGRGGLSGRPLRAAALRALARTRVLTRGELPLIGVGGIDGPDAAYERIRAGASLVEAYTGFVYRGPGLAGEINRGLAERLARDGFPNVAAAVGVDAARCADGG